MLLSDGSHGTLQRQNAENLKQIFPEKEYRGLSPNFHIHVSVSELQYIFQRWVCLFCWRKYVDRSWEYINRSQTHECGNWGWGRAIPRKETYKRNCRCSAEDVFFWLHFLGIGLFLCLNQAHNCFFSGYMVKGICSQDTFRGILEYFNFFHFRPFPATGLWSKCGYRIGRE